MTARQEVETILASLSAAELRHLADAAELAERRLADQRVEQLSSLLWDRPALGAYRKKGPT
jgi:hypothetical protein